MTVPSPIFRVRFTRDEAEAAGNEWGFNCGPAALCAMVGMTPDEIRPRLLDFKTKGYINPTLMTDILRGLHIVPRQVYRGDVPAPMPQLVHGLVRVQWSGPWTRPNVPMRVRYRHTHWVGIEGDRVFDINAMCVGGWLPAAEWASQLVPWLIRECCPKGDGSWWPTHAIETPVCLDGPDNEIKALGAP